MQPLVSIYCPTNSRPRLFHRALSSILAQTYKNIEVIVINDGADPETREVFNKETYGAQHIKYVEIPVSAGANYARNRAIEVATGEFITGLDDDDYFYPNRIKKFVAFSGLLSKSQKLRPIFLFDRRSRVEGPLGYIFQKKIVRQRDLWKTNYVGNQVFTYTAVMQENIFDEQVNVWQDLECWARILKDRYAIRLPNASYYVDTRHSCGRISDSLIDEREKTIRILGRKHNLKKCEMDNLRQRLKE